MRGSSAIKGALERAESRSNFEPWDNYGSWDELWEDQDERDPFEDTWIDQELPE